MKAKTPWYRFQAQTADETVADIYIDDFIGDWIDQMMKEWLGTKSPITAKQFIADLTALPDTVKTIRVHINSPGGDFFGATQIANALRDQRASKGRAVETIVEGLAASAASIVLMAGEPVRIADNAIVMIHDPYSATVGNASEMRKTAEALDRIRDSIVAVYRWHSELSEQELAVLMAAETWMDADEAIANGFATEKVEGLKASASIAPGPAAQLKVPERFAARVAALVQREEPPAPPAVATLDDVVALCRPAGLDLEFAATLATERLTPAAAATRVAAEKASRAAESTRQADIRALCTKFKVDDMAADLISGGTTFEAARALVGKVTAKVDKVEIDGGLAPDAGTGRSKPVIDTQAIYAQRNTPRA